MSTSEAHREDGHSLMNYPQGHPATQETDSADTAELHSGQCRRANAVR